jgi:hypothetical protein
MSKIPKELILQNIGKHLELKDAVKLFFLSKDFARGTRIHCKSIVTKLENLENKLRIFQSDTIEIKLKYTHVESQVDIRRFIEAMDIIKKANIKNLCLQIEGYENQFSKIFRKLNVSLESLKIIVITYNLKLNFDFKDIDVKRFSIYTTTMFLNLMSSGNVLKELEEIEIRPLLSEHFVNFKIKSVKANRVRFSQLEVPLIVLSDTIIGPKGRDVSHPFGCETIIDAKRILSGCYPSYVADLVDFVDSDFEKLLFQKTGVYGDPNTLKISINSDDLKKLVLETKKTLPFVLNFRKSYTRVRDLQCRSNNLLIIEPESGDGRRLNIYQDLLIDTLSIDWTIPEKNSNSLPNCRYVKLPRCNVSELNIKTVMKTNKLNFNGTEIRNVIIHLHSTYHKIFLYLKNASINDMIIFAEYCEKLTVRTRLYNVEVIPLKIIAKKGITITSDIPYTLQEL